MGWYQTFGVTLVDGRCVRFCAFQSKLYAQGDHAKVHKGKLFLRVEVEKIIVKVFPEVPNAGYHCKAELDKQKLAMNVLKKCPELQKKVQLVLKSRTSVSEVGFWNKFFSKKPLRVDTPVLIQERLDTDDIQDFRKLRTYQSSKSQPNSNPLLELARKSLVISKGSYVIIGAKGVVSKENGVRTYHLTSLIVHSKDRRYGCHDEGEHGIRHFLKKTGLNGVMIRRPALQPSAPPEEPEVTVDIPRKDKSLEAEKTKGEKKNLGFAASKEELLLQAKLLALGDLPPHYDHLVQTLSTLRWRPPPPYCDSQFRC